MSALVHYSNCPVCNSREIDPLLTVQDYTVSKEKFVIWHCHNCSLRFTQDVPDESSISQYYKSEDYISHSNSSKGFINSLYQNVKAHTLQKKAALVIKATGITNGRLLDVGSGTGAFLNTMQKKGWQVTGLEPDEEARAKTKKLYRLDTHSSEHLFELQPASYDAITLWHVLEHVHELHDYIEQLKVLLKPNGKLFVAVPNYTSADADAYNLKWAAYDVPRHLYHFSPQSMAVLMQKHKLSIVAKKPMWFDSFYISMLSSKYKNGRTHWLGATWVGLTSNLKTLFNTDRCSSIIYIIEKARN